MKGESVLTASELDVLRQEFDVVPFVRELSADTITPVGAFAAIDEPEAEAFLLESVERGENVGRYSFIGLRPRRKITFDRSAVDPVAVLERELVPLRVYQQEKLPPFFGGAVAFFGYGVARWSERLPDRHPEEIGIADAEILFFDRVIVFDHVRQLLSIVVNVFSSDPRTSDELIEAAYQQLAESESRLRRATVDMFPIPAAGDRTRIPFEAANSRAAFLDIVQQAKEEIVAGEIFQIVLSQRWGCRFPEAEALTLYRALRTINPSPYMFILRTSDCTLVGASPEMLVKVAGEACETRPIAGTRPRGLTREEDSRLEKELLADPKENAEHLMLVDLGRNDLGRVSKRGSVEVVAFSQVERYSHVMHLVSSVRSEKREEVTPIEAFLSCFPAGTVTGAPKIRAMELIDELEFSRRGPYAGAIAYIGFSGNLDSCIAIRTIVLANDHAWIQAGAGIVYDSIAENEYDETMNKAAALKRSVELALAIIDRRRAGEGER